MLNVRERERAAKAIHEAWVAEKQALGFVGPHIEECPQCGSNVRYLSNANRMLCLGECGKSYSVDANLVPFEQLPEHMKTAEIEAIEAAEQAFEIIGYKLCSCDTTCRSSV